MLEIVPFFIPNEKLRDQLPLKTLFKVIDLSREKKLLLISTQFEFWAKLIPKLELSELGGEFFTFNLIK